MRALKTLMPVALCAVLSAGPAWPHDGVKDPAVMARMMSMSQMGKALKVLTDMAKGVEPLHQGKARMARDTIALQSGRITTLFTEPATDPKTEALPAIWENWADFSARAETLNTKAPALDFRDRAALADTLGGVAGNCRACHKTYREKK